MVVFHVTDKGPDNAYQMELIFQSISKEDRIPVRLKIEKKIKELQNVYPNVLGDTSKQTYKDLLDSFLSWCNWEFGEEPVIIPEDEVQDISLSLRA